MPGIAFAERQKSSEEYQNIGDRAKRAGRGWRRVERGTSGTPKKKKASEESLAQGDANATESLQQVVSVCQ